MVTVQTTAAPAGGARAASAWFDWLVLAASAWLVGGALLDGWAHIHIALLDTFFTPWHGILYSGFAACAAVPGAGWVRGRTLRDWSLPNAYRLSCRLHPLCGRRRTWAMRVPSGCVGSSRRQTLGRGVRL